MKKQFSEHYQKYTNKRYTHEMQEMPQLNPIPQLFSDRKTFAARKMETSFI